MFEMPEELGGLSAADLDALLAAAREEAAEIQTALSDPDTADTADLARLGFLADSVDAINVALAAVATVAAERAEVAAAALARINPVALAAVEDEIVPDAEVADELAAEEAVVEAAEAVVAAVEVPTVTGIIMPSPRSVAALAPKGKLPTPVTREVAIVAAAGLSGVRGGQAVSLADMVKPAIKRWESYQGYAGNQQDELFSLRAPARDPKLVASGRSFSDQEVMEYAANQSRLSRLASAKPQHKGIVAAGGWCAPAEQRFDICTLAELDGILDVPTIGMPRGSLSYFRQLDYSTVATAIAAGEFTFTNAQLVVDPPVVKPCFEIPCASPVNATLSVVGLCLRAGLLQNKAFPELIEAWMRLALIAFAHYRNARNIAQIVAGSGTAIVTPVSFGAISQVYEAVALQATVYRAQNGMAMDAELEVVFPYWLPEVFQIDHERRQFNSEGSFDFAADLAELNVRAQWVKDYQDSAFVAADPVTLWPTTVNFLLYAPGAWVRGSEDVINVSTLVDSTLLQTNRLQLLFFEAADVMLPWCGPSKQVTVAICATGTTAGPMAAVGTPLTCGE
jgi:hypothetical protein